MKSILKQCVSWLLSFVFGVFGGYAYTHWHAAKVEKVATLRSSRFELTDNSGRVVAFWGTDRGNDTVLAFLQKANQDMVPTGYGSNPNEALAVGMTSTQSPFINLQAKDGSSRAQLNLSEYQKPVFIMSDEHYEGRLMLGFISNDYPSPEDDDWALLFRGPDVAGIGSMKHPVDLKYRGYLTVARNPKIR